jgi:hypothetical protein
MQATKAGGCAAVFLPRTASPPRRNRACSRDLPDVRLLLVLIHLLSVTILIGSGFFLYRYVHVLERHNGFIPEGLPSFIFLEENMLTSKTH